MKKIFFFGKYRKKVWTIKCKTCRVGGGSRVDYIFLLQAKVLSSNKGEVLRSEVTRKKRRKF